MVYRDAIGYEYLHHVYLNGAETFAARKNERRFRVRG
jgi:hypothetical protein